MIYRLQQHDKSIISSSFKVKGIFIKYNFNVFSIGYIIFIPENFASFRIGSPPVAKIEEGLKWHEQPVKKGIFILKLINNLRAGEPPLPFGRQARTMKVVRMTLPNNKTGVLALILAKDF